MNSLSLPIRGKIFPVEESEWHKLPSAPRCVLFTILFSKCGCNGTQIFHDGASGCGPAGSANHSLNPIQFSNLLEDRRKSENCPKLELEYHILDKYCQNCKDRSPVSQGLPETVIAERVARWKSGIELQDVKKEIGHPERKAARRKRWEEFIMMGLLKEEIDDVPQSQRVILYDPKLDWSNFFALVDDDKFSRMFPGQKPMCWLCFDNCREYWTVRQLPCGCLFHPKCFDAHIWGVAVWDNKMKCRCPMKKCTRIYNLVPMPSSFEDPFYPR
jgi:hypothetical protein